jgi:hypothetical protein
MVRRRSRNNGARKKRRRDPIELRAPIGEVAAREV